ncbi:MAG: TROVE domain-containing protein [Tannerella sp.]|jgi:hypothetical protein|nr:TROVE domain-containing protein [Tannerella sp.]
MPFNSTSKGKDKVTNHEGAEAYRMSPEWHLYVATVTSSLCDKFYESAETRMQTLRTLVSQCDPLFVAKLAVYTRQKMNLRSVPLVLAVELAKVHSGDAIIRKMVNQIVLRADEITELLAYYQQANERRGNKKLNRLSKQLQTGLQDAFNRFNEYQFAKYNRETEIKLRDALFLVHPKAKNEEQQVLFNKIINNTLEPPYTWESELSQLGKSTFETIEERNDAFRLKWEELINSGKVGYMALLRNLRNMLEARVSDNQIDKVCNTLASENAVRRSKQLPFRFLAAYREISTYSQLIIKEASLETKMYQMKKLQKELQQKENWLQKTSLKEVSEKDILRIEIQQNAIQQKRNAQRSKLLWSYFPKSYQEAYDASTTNPISVKIQKAIIELKASNAQKIVFVQNEVNKLNTLIDQKTIDVQKAEKESDAKITSAKVENILKALETAVTVSAENIKGFNAETSVLIACDVSGSMQQPISPRSKIFLYDIGLMLAMLLKSRCANAVTGMFGDTWKIIDVPAAGILSNVEVFYKREGEVGYSTNGYLVIKYLLEIKKKMDKIMIFTDMQLWNSYSDKKITNLWTEYRRFSPDSKLYLFDLAGYGTTPLDMIGNNVYLIAG